ncbi:hypothetical protein CARUB_v10012259mg [Capsella rubella]|uniref:Uncharacterized protein n=1 Tax=Capsella rubella TaxID=81985 RepID=R0GNZ6_9BRAS|nr:uncharacterized protein LOC17899394 [Capsella rubella]EOA37667.1 hypothetical protein CARUB_v10012259mg [Capsella rubella]
MADQNNTAPFEVTKLDHYIKYQPEAEDFIVDVEVKVLRQGSSSPPLEMFFSSLVDEFIWEDEDCQEKVELYELLVDEAGIDASEAQFLLYDLILYVCNMTQPLDKRFTGVFSLMFEVRVKPVDLNHAGSEQTKSQ